MITKITRVALLFDTGLGLALSEYKHHPLPHTSLFPIYLLLPHTSLPVSTPNTIHHFCLTSCLYDSLDLRPLPIDFVLSRRLSPVYKLVPASSLLWAI